MARQGQGRPTDMDFSPKTRNMPANGGSITVLLHQSFALWLSCHAVRTCIARELCGTSENTLPLVSAQTSQNYLIPTPGTSAKATIQILEECLNHDVTKNKWHRVFETHK